MEEVTAKAQVVVSRRGQSCHKACVERSRGCHTWGLQLFNDERVLREGWKTAGFRTVFNLTDGTETVFRDIEVSDVRRDGSALRLFKEETGVQWILELADWSKGPNCDAHTYFSYSVCPCF